MVVAETTSAVNVSAIAVDKVVVTERTAVLVVVSHATVTTTMLTKLVLLL